MSILMYIKAKWDSAYLGQFFMFVISEMACRKHMTWLPRPWLLYMIQVGFKFLAFESEGQVTMAVSVW